MVPLSISFDLDSILHPFLSLSASLSQNFIEDMIESWLIRVKKYVRCWRHFGVFLYFSGSAIRVGHENYTHKQTNRQSYWLISNHSSNCLIMLCPDGTSMCRRLLSFRTWYRRSSSYRGSCAGVTDLGASYSGQKGLSTAVLLLLLLGLSSVCSTAEEQHCHGAYDLYFVLDK